MPTIKTPIQIRFSDVDAFAHVNNVAQQMYFDLGKLEAYRDRQHAISYDDAGNPNLPLC